MPYEHTKPSPNPNGRRSHTISQSHARAAARRGHTQPWRPPPSPPPPRTPISSAVVTPTPPSEPRIEAASGPSDARPPPRPRSRPPAAKRRNRSAGGCRSSRRGKRRTRTGTTTCTASGRRLTTWTSPSVPGPASSTISSLGISSAKTVSAQTPDQLTAVQWFDEAW